MTSFDDLQLDDHQDLSDNEEVLIRMVTPPIRQQGWNWSPLIVAILVTITAIFLNSGWMSEKLENIPYYRFSLLGLLFSLTLFYILFLN